MTGSGGTVEPAGPARPADYVVGFTGTRTGMTPDQIGTVQAILDDHAIVEVHHGDCVGADADFHRQAQAWGIPVVIHPPNNPTHRAWCKGKKVMDEKPYLDRNRDIVNAADMVIATPKERTLQGRGGTWFTIGYARLQGKKLVIVWPDGTTLIDGSFTSDKPVVKDDSG